MESNEKRSSKIALMFSMLIFGTIGIFKEYIPIASGLLAMLRGVVGALFLLMIFIIYRKKFDFKAIKQNLFILILSGVAIGFNWILLFEAYNYTTIATATLCYYMAPVFVMFASPLFLKENLTRKQFICSLFAIIGMVLVSGIFEVGFSNIKELIGVFFGLGAALLYATVIILNKKIVTVAAFERTIIQLASAGIILIPYTLIFEDTAKQVFNAKVLLLVLIVCLVHTGITYCLYFYSIKNVKAQTAAIYSYIDPIVAILLSGIILKQQINLPTIIGAVIILGSTLISEINFKKVRPK